MTRRSPSLVRIRVLIIRPSATARLAASSATMPAARLVIQKACSAMALGLGRGHGGRGVVGRRRGRVVGRRAVLGGVRVLLAGRGRVADDVVVAVDATWAVAWSSARPWSRRRRRDPRRGRRRRACRRRRAGGSVGCDAHEPRCVRARWRRGRERACSHPRAIHREPAVRTLRGSWVMTTTVIFDLDGVLVDSRAVFLSCVNYAFDKLGLAQREPAELLPYIGPPFAYAFGELLGVPHDAPVVAACIDGYRERYKTASLTETTVEPGIPEALAALDGHRLAVATSKPYAFAEPLLEAHGPARALRGHRRPRPRARAPRTRRRRSDARCAQLGPTRAVMVGDRSFDILAAQGARAAVDRRHVGHRHGAGAARRGRRPADRDARRAPRDGKRPARPIVSGPCSRSSTCTRSRSGCTSRPPSSASARRSRSPSASRSRSSSTRATCRSSTT